MLIAKYSFTIYSLVGLSTLNYICTSINNMKHQTLRIYFSVLLLCASVLFAVPLFMYKYGTDEQFLLVVEVLLFVFLSSANYTDRKEVLVGRRKTHFVIIILLSIVLSINGLLLITKVKNTSTSLRSSIEHAVIYN